MPNTNKNLYQAKKRKNDEFYTTQNQVEYIINSILYENPTAFTNKKIICPCDDEHSEFVKYLTKNFKFLKLRKLTFCSVNSNVVTSLNKKGNIKFNIIDHNGQGILHEKIKNLIAEHDICITNPPFSILSKTYKTLTQNKFILIVPTLICETVYANFPQVKLFPSLLKKFHNGKEVYVALHTNICKLKLKPYQTVPKDKVRTINDLPVIDSINKVPDNYKGKAYAIPTIRTTNLDLKVLKAEYHIPHEFLKLLVEIDTTK